MLVRDEKITKTLIKGLASEKVTVDNLSEYFGKQCLFVGVHQKNQADRKITLSDLLMQHGVSDETMEFFAEYKNRTQVSIFPTREMKKVHSIFQSVRHKRDVCSFGRNGLMTAETYKDIFRPFYLDKVQELEETVTALSKGYDTYVSAFKKGFERMLEDVGVSEEDAGTIKKDVYRSIPRKEDLDSMFGLQLSLKAYPVITSISLLDGDISSDVKDSISETAIESVYEILGTSLSNAFKQVNDILVYYQRTYKLKDSDRKKVQILAAKLAKENLLKNVLISELSDGLKEIISATSTDDEVAEQLEDTLCKIYKFATETDTVNDLVLKDCILPKAELERYL